MENVLTLGGQKSECECPECDIENIRFHSYLYVNYPFLSPTIYAYGNILRPRIMRSWSLVDGLLENV